MSPLSLPIRHDVDVVLAALRRDPRDYLVVADLRALSAPYNSAISETSPSSAHLGQIDGVALVLGLLAVVGRLRGGVR